MRLSPHAISVWLPGDSIRRGLATNSLGIMVLRTGSMALGFISTIILARYLGASGYGIYAWAIAWATVLQLIATLGLDTLTVREVAAQKTLATWSAMRGLLRSSTLIVLCSSLIAAAGVIAVGFAFVSSAQQATFVIAIAIVPILTLTSVREGAMQGLGRIIPSRLPEDLFRPSAFILLLIVGWRVLSLPESAPTAMALQGIATFLAFLVGLLLLRWALPGQLSSAVGHLQVMPWVKQALPFVVLRAVNTLLSQIDVILVGFLRDSTQVALYATATRIAALVGIAEFAVNAAYLPIISRLFVESGVVRLRTGAPLVALVGVALSAIIAAPLIAFAPYVLHFFGPSFSDGVFALRILCVSFVLSAVSGLNIALLNMTRHVRAVIVGSAFGLAANVILNIILIPRYGANGAAIAWLLSILIWNGILELQVRRSLGISATPLALIPIATRSILTGSRSR